MPKVAIQKILSLGLMCGMLMACSNTVFVNYECQPEGATLYEDGVRDMGQCPITARYNPTEQDIKEGRLYTKPVTAVWKTGSSVTVPAVPIDLATTHKAFFNFAQPMANAAENSIDSNGISYARKRPAFDTRPTSTRPDQDAFESFDRITSCAFYNLIDAVYAECE